MVQESCTYIFCKKNQMVNYQIFHQKNGMFLKTSYEEFSYIEVWLADQNSEPSEMEDKINISLIIN